MMWINNCVFQGAGLNGRAIDTDTDRIDGRKVKPSLYIKGTLHALVTVCITVRNRVSGIRVLRNP